MKLNQTYYLFQHKDRKDKIDESDLHDYIAYQHEMQTCKVDANYREYIRKNFKIKKVKLITVK